MGYVTGQRGFKTINTNDLKTQLSTLSAMREMHIKAILRLCLIPVRMAAIQKSNDNQHGWERDLDTLLVGTETSAAA